jgi:hypothetical protein
MSVGCECCVLSGRGLCDELITRTEGSYRLWPTGGGAGVPKTNKQRVLVDTVTTAWLSQNRRSGDICR